MTKILLIGIKDIRIAFRDRAALIMMLVAPFTLTLGLGVVTGQFAGGSGGGLSQIPIILVNQDAGQLGDALVELFQSDELVELFAALESRDVALARSQVDADQVAAAIIIPEGFTASIIPAQGEMPSGAVVQIEVYTNPTRPVSSGVTQAVVEAFISRVETGRIGGEVIVRQLIGNNLLSLPEVQSYAEEMGQRQASAQSDDPPLNLRTAADGVEAPAFNPMAFMAPGMALMFLMFTVANGGRSILTERSGGTLPRLLITPTGTPQILLGKVIGIYTTGTVQMLILITASSLLFNVAWGNPLGVLLLILAAVFGASGWGMLLTALARTPGQVASVGTAIMLTFGILGGTFINLEMMPVPIQWLSRITPNAWGLDGFTTLALGGNIANLTGPITALLVMGVTLFTISFTLFNRRSILQN
jgi:ABC-2 type transport system permease protein